MMELTVKLLVWRIQILKSFEHSSNRCLQIGSMDEADISFKSEPRL